MVSITKAGMTYHCTGLVVKRYYGNHLNFSSVSSHFNVTNAGKHSFQTIVLLFLFLTFAFNVIGLFCFGKNDKKYCKHKKRVNFYIRPSDGQGKINTHSKVLKTNISMLGLCTQKDTCRQTSEQKLFNSIIILSLITVRLASIE